MIEGGQMSDLARLCKVRCCAGGWVVAFLLGGVLTVLDICYRYLLFRRVFYAYMVAVYFCLN